MLCIADCVVLVQGSWQQSGTAYAQKVQTRLELCQISCEKASFFQTSANLNLWRLVTSLVLSEPNSF